MSGSPPGRQHGHGEPLRATRFHFRPKRNELLGSGGGDIEVLPERGGQGTGVAARAQKRGVSRFSSSPPPTLSRRSVCRPAGLVAYRRRGRLGTSRRERSRWGRGRPAGWDGGAGEAAGGSRGRYGHRRPAPPGPCGRPVWQGLPGKWWAFGRRGRQGGGGGRGTGRGGASGPQGPSVSGGCRTRARAGEEAVPEPGAGLSPGGVT